MWTERATVEINRSKRTWMGTLTWSPHNHYLAYCRAFKDNKERAVDLNGLDQKDRFERLCRAHTPAVTNWLKRVRKECAQPLRYLLVWEPHKSGYPHVHVLIHEQEGPVRHSVLRDQWQLGFSKFNLVKMAEGPQAARYVAKYLTKASEGARVRASLRYGQDGLSHSESVNIKTQSKDAARVEI